jgi:hypothetical protein
MKYFSVLLLFSIFILGCTKDRTFETNLPGGNNPPPIDSFNVVGSLKVNEVVSSGSTLISELGPGGDWFEIYNPKTTACTLEAGKWFVTDDFTNPEQFELPSITINALSRLVVFCDDSNKVLTQIHTNFKLSSAGDKLGIIYKAASSYVFVDSVSFGAQGANEASARIPDGSPNWVFPVIPTPGEPNQ